MISTRNIPVGYVMLAKVLFCFGLYAAGVWLLGERIATIAAVAIAAYCLGYESGKARG